MAAIAAFGVHLPAKCEPRAARLILLASITDTSQQYNAPPMDTLPVHSKAFCIHEGRMSLALEYMNVLTTTTAAPSANRMFGSKPNSRTEHSVESSVEIPVANPFKMLSAYLMTIATIMPPRAFTTTTVQTRRS